MTADNVNHPAHYAEGWSNGSEVIDITENLNFNLGNVVKYVARAGRKTADPFEDLRKAQFYLEREIVRLTFAADQENLPELPDGLSYKKFRLWTDCGGALWRWAGDFWEYFDAEDDSWYSVRGAPSHIYAPFKEVT